MIRDDTLVDQLRRLQYAANMLSYTDFCQILDWPQDDYSRDKFKSFQDLELMHRFDGHVLTALVAGYEKKFGA